MHTVSSTESMNLPSGAVTLMMTDMEDSTRWVHELGNDFDTVVERHHQLINQVVAAHGGTMVDSTGDAHFSVFTSATDAVAAAADLGGRFEQESWPGHARIRVRAGLHSGSPRVSHRRYVGLDVHRTARICGAGHGGQVLLSGSTFALVQSGTLPSGLRLREVGTCKLKDLRYPENLWELLVPGLPDKFPPVRGTQPTNLPPLAEVFVGRTSERHRISELLAGGTRFVTLTGPGGVGKTRLATEVASSLLAHFPDGVFFVPFEAVSDAELVVPTIAHVLGIPELAGRPVFEGLKHHLAATRTLLVLDNFEQVLDASGMIVDLLASCERVRAIVTSRAALCVRFEQEVPLSALGLSTESADTGTIRSEAGRLFLSRVGEFRPDYAPDAADAEAIEEICRRVDGLPLAIELAASRLRVLTPRALLDRLQSGIAVLSGGRRDASRRHQALQATITWSYELLSSEERLLFRQLSVFPGGFTLEAAEAVAALGMSDVDLLDRIALLVQRSLIRTEEVDAEPRFRMLNTIREFGIAELDTSPEKEATRARFAHYYVELAQEQSQWILGKERRRALSRLFTEVDNLRAAFAWALERPDAEATAQLLQSLLWLRISQGQFAEGRNWIERALLQARSLGKTAAHGLILDAAGWLALFSGDYAGSLPHSEQALEIFQGLGMRVETARSLLTFGIARAVTGDEGGPALLEQSLALHQELGDPYGIALSLTALGEGARMGGQEQAARECYQGAIELYGSLGNVYWPAALKHNLAHFCLHEGDWRGAVAFLNDLLEVAREFDFPMMVGHYLAAMGGVAVVRERFELAATLFGAVSTLLERLGATFEPPDHAELERNQDVARSTLGAADFDRAYAAGRKLASDQAMLLCTSLRE